MKILCQHCNRRKANRPRHLCFGCFQDVGIREQYAPRESSASPVPTVSSSPLPATPTLAIPGTEQKVRVMEERALRGESLFHPGEPRLSNFSKYLSRLLEALAMTGDD